jgi:hypothetical protein
MIIKLYSLDKPLGHLGLITSLACFCSLPELVAWVSTSLQLELLSSSIRIGIPKMIYRLSPELIALGRNSKCRSIV